MSCFFNHFFKTTEWFNQLLTAYFIIIFPAWPNHQFSHTDRWYNQFNGFFYSNIGLRYDPLSNLYIDLFGYPYYYDTNQKIYWNLQGNIFDQSGWSYSIDKSSAIDFFGNQYFWCPNTNRYRYAKLWPRGTLIHCLAKGPYKPVMGPVLAARIFLLKNDAFRLHAFLFRTLDQLDSWEGFFPFLLLGTVISNGWSFVNKNSLTVKTTFTGLLLWSLIIINPIGEVSMINQKLPELEPTRTFAEFNFKNLETFKQTRATTTQPLTKSFYQKSIRVSASAKQISKGFSFDDPASTLTVSPHIDPSRYNSVDLLQDLAKCLEVHTKTFLDHKQKQNLDVDPSLKSGIQKLYKQIDIATHVAREKEEYLKQFGSATQLEGVKLVTRLNETIEKRAFDKKGNTIQKKNLNLNQTVAQQLREYGRFPLSGIQTLVAIKNDPQAVLTKVEGRQIDQEFAKTPYGERMRAINSIRAHILSDSWSTVPTGKDSQKVLSYKLPFNRFPAPIINNQENFVTTPAFLEKLLDSFKNVETGVFPTFLQKKFESNPAWRPEKNYIIANAFYDDFYLPALSHHEKKYALEIRKQLRKSRNNSQNQNSANKKTPNRENTNSG